MYNPDNQYRCTIIRGKSQSEMEDLLPFYAQTVHAVCPCTKVEFDERCNNQLALHLFSNSRFSDLPDANQKTVRNHITEIMGSLLGLFCVDTDDYVYESNCCTYILAHNDFPTFFKSICLNLQFPNASQAIQTVKQRIADKICIRPLCFVVSLLYLANTTGKNILLTKQEIGYYALNNKDVLMGTATAQEVFCQIMQDRQENVRKERLSGSRNWQHIKEMFNLLDLSNISISDNKYIWLNKDEERAIKIFLDFSKKPLFNILKYNPNNPTSKAKMVADWQKYYSTICPEISALETPVDKTAEVVIINDEIPIKQQGAVGLSTVELGDKGEALVYKMECKRVRLYKTRLVNKVLLLGKTKGLGYDISSIEANENTDNPEYARYIEVKSTKRVTVPSFDAMWTDTLSLTEKEWTAAKQYKEYYNIYRVYFTRNKVFVIRINNPFQKKEQGIIEVYPTIFQMDFNKKAITEHYACE